MLGSIPSGYLQLNQIDSFTTEVKRKTSLPFQINFFVDYDEHSSANLLKPDEIFQIERGLNVESSNSVTIPILPSLSEMLDISIKHNIPIISTTFGVPNDKDMQLIKDNNIILLITVNSREETRIALVDYAADAIVYQNDQAGGHKGGFLEKGYSNDADILATKETYPNSIIIKSGGIADKQDINQALHQGFDGVQIGTGFLMTNESTATALHKEEIIKTNSVEDIVSTHYITGKMATGIKNKLTLLSHQSTLKYPLLHYTTVDLRVHAKKAGIMDYQSLWAGKGAIAINEVQELSNYMQSLI
jgi:nitronate monooxygenase